MAAPYKAGSGFQALGFRLQLDLTVNAGILALLFLLFLCFPDGSFVYHGVVATECLQ